MNFTPELLEIIWDIRLEMHMGRSLALSLQNALDKRKSPLSQVFSVWMMRIRAGHSHRQVMSSLNGLCGFEMRIIFLNLLERGFRGAPVDVALAEFESELIGAVEVAHEKHLQTLPLKLLIPLALFILPAVGMLLVGPFIMVFLSGR